MAVLPFATWEPVPSHSGPMSAHLGLVLHVQVGNGDCYGEFDNPANSASSTWWVSKAGQLVQYVDSDLIAWTQAAGNSTWNGVETEGFPTEALTDAQILTLARLYVWGHNEYGWPLTQSEDPLTPGFGWHGMGGAAWGGHFGCPGDLRKPQRAAVLFIAGLALGTIPPPKEEVLNMQCTDPDTGGVWCLDVTDGSIWAYSVDGSPVPPYLGGFNAHLGWNVDCTKITGISAFGSPGNHGYVISVKSPGPGFAQYAFTRDGKFV